MTMTTILLNDIRDLVQTQLQTLLTHGAVGDGATAPTVGDTVLDNETYRVAIDSVDTTTPGELVVTVIIGFTFNNGNTVAEVGLFDAVAAGELKERSLVTSIAKVSTLQLYLDFTFTWTVTEV